MAGLTGRLRRLGLSAQKGEKGSILEVLGEKEASNRAIIGVLASFPLSDRLTLSRS